MIDPENKEETKNTKNSQYKKIQKVFFFRLKKNRIVVNDRYRRHKKKD